MESRIRELLDKTFELEGLLQLSLMREDSMNSIFRLIKAKGEEIARACLAFDREGSPSEYKRLEESPNFSAEDDFAGTYETIDEDYEPTEYSLVEESEYSLPEEGEKKEIKETAPEQVKDKLSKEPGGKSIFSINEKYRFKRELFNNSDLDFNNTLALLASMEDYEEAENYFYNDIMMNPKEPIVIEFLEVIKRYFR